MSKPRTISEIVNDVTTKEAYDQAKEKLAESVSHPAHYCREGAVECIDEMLMIFGREDVMTFCKLNAWKYRYRAADKNGQQDIAKSDWYMRKYRELMFEEEKQNGHENH